MKTFKIFFCALLEGIKLSKEYRANKYKGML